MVRHIFVSEKPFFNQKEKPITRTYLREISAGNKGNIVGYDQTLRGYQGKLMTMGLLPGTQFTLLGVFSNGYWVEIEVQGSLYRLRKQEADALVIEEINLDEPC